MTRYPDRDLTRWKCEINAGPIIASRISLRRENAEWVGLCPFHEEKTPSFKVYKNDERAWLFKCFGCGKTGNVFQFVQEHDNVSFARAVEIVLAEAGTMNSAEVEVQSKHKKFVTFTMAQYAQAVRALEGSPAGQKWITDRGITMETARRFHLGFVEDGTAFCGTDHPWRTKGWIAFPTLSAPGHRVFSIKYRSLVAKKEMVGERNVSGILRAPHTPTILFNIREVNEDAPVFITEGEPDAMVLSQTGTPAVGLPSATYVPSPDECTVLKRATRRFLAGDADKAGTRTMERLWKQLGAHTYLIRWPDGCKDANDALLNICGGDDEKFSQLLDKLTTKAIQQGEWKEPLATRASSYAATGQNPIQNGQPLIVRPTLNETACYGLAGRIVKKLEPHTESHPAGLLFELMLSFGNVIGRNAYIQVESTKHFTNEFMVKVGESSRSRKGTGKNRIREIMNQVDPEWLANRSVSGIGSGEVIIHLVRDPHTEYFFDKKKGTGARVVTDAGIDDKRLCVNLGEFQQILSVAHRPDNLLSVVLRDAWDGLPLHNLVKTNPASCAEGLVSVMADITLADLTVGLSQADRNNGFANRFLWVYVYRTKLLPEGGEEIEWRVEAAELRAALEFSTHVGRVFMDKAARDRWCRTVYPKLERDIPGLVGTLTARGSAHVMRLALLYALLDESDHIRIEHLEAAEAAWQYSEDSVQSIFGDLLSPDQAKIIEFLDGREDATKKCIIHDCFSGHRKAEAIQADLNLLADRGDITVKEVNEVCHYRRVRKTNGSH